jgi:hypothetical protein
MSARHIALSLVLALIGVFALGGSALAASGSVTKAKPKPCLIVAQGPSWSGEGQSGTAYNVAGINGGSCKTGVKWLQRFTHETAMVFKGPAGWSCIQISLANHQGECTLKNGGIVEWSPKLKKK